MYDVMSSSGVVVGVCGTWYAAWDGFFKIIISSCDKCPQVLKTIDSFKSHMFHLQNILSIFLLTATNHVLGFSLIDF